MPTWAGPGGGEGSGMLQGSGHRCRNGTRRVHRRHRGQARDNADWNQLLDLCTLTDTLIAYTDRSTTRRGFQRQAGARFARHDERGRGVSDSHPRRPIGQPSEKVTSNARQSALIGRTHSMSCRSTSTCWLVQYRSSGRATPRLRLALMPSEASRRALVKPGLTGVCQVRRSNLEGDEAIRLDLRYVETGPSHWTCCSCRRPSQRLSRGGAA